MYTPQCRYEKDFDKHVRKLPTSKVGQFDYVNKPLRAVLASEADKLATVSNNKPTPRVPGPYEVITVRDSTLTIFGDGRENTISIDCSTRIPGVDKRQCDDAINDKDSEISSRPKVLRYCK